MRLLWNIINRLLVYSSSGSTINWKTNDKCIYDFNKDLFAHFSHRFYMNSGFVNNLKVVFLRLIIFCVTLNSVSEEKKMKFCTQAYFFFYLILCNP